METIATTEIVGFIEGTVSVLVGFLVVIVDCSLIFILMVVEGMVSCLSFTDGIVVVITVVLDAMLEVSFVVVATKMLVG